MSFCSCYYLIKDDKLKSCFLYGGKEYWKNKLKELEKYIEQYGKFPSINDDNLLIDKLARWLSAQCWRYKQKLQIMTDEEIRLLFEQFMEKYKHLVNNPKKESCKYELIDKNIKRTNEEIWIEILNMLKKHFDKTNERPTNTNEDPHVCYL